MKNRYQLIAALAALFIGNRIYNHWDAWTGIAVMAFSVLFTFYKLIKILQK